ncbi:MAG: hypothetical protein JXA60_10555 [Candidatus Coatesbacteria bacterium]|nr:hypothetical protein [Candidatus Coatesbacteria bacterium]
MKTGKLIKELQFDSTTIKHISITNEVAELLLLGKEESNQIALEYYSDIEDAEFEAIEEEDALKIELSVGKLIMNAPSNIFLEISNVSGPCKIRDFQKGGDIDSEAGPLKMDGIKEGNWNLDIENAPLDMRIDGSLENLSISSENGPVKVSLKNVHHGDYSISSDNGPVKIIIDKVNDLSINVESKNTPMLSRINLPKADGKYVVGKGTAEVNIETEYGPIMLVSDDVSYRESKAKNDYREEKLRILKMVESNKITVEEGMRLLNTISDKEKKESDENFGLPKVIFVSCFATNDPVPKWSISVPIRLFHGQKSVASLLGIDINTKQSRYSKRIPFIDMELGDFLPNKIFGNCETSGIDWLEIEEKYSVQGNFIFHKLTAENEEIVVEIKGD